MKTLQKLNAIVLGGMVLSLAPTLAQAGGGGKCHPAYVVQERPGFFDRMATRREERQAARQCVQAAPCVTPAPRVVTYGPTTCGTPQIINGQLITGSYQQPLLGSKVTRTYPGKMVVNGYLVDTMITEYIDNPGYEVRDYNSNQLITGDKTGIKNYPGSEEILSNNRKPSNANFQTFQEGSNLNTGAPKPPVNRRNATFEVLPDDEFGGIPTGAGKR